MSRNAEGHEGCREYCALWKEARETTALAMLRQSGQLSKGDGLTLP